MSIQKRDKFAIAMTMVGAALNLCQFLRTFIVSNCYITNISLQKVIFDALKNGQNQIQGKEYDF